MSRFFSRLTPITIVAITLLLTAKAVHLAHELAPPAAATTPPSPSSVPKAGAPAAASSNGATAKATGACAKTQADPDEVRLLGELRRRRDALDVREKQLDQRDDLLHAEDLKLQSRLNDLEALQKQLDGLDQARRTRDGQNWAGLVAMYEDMKARDAAAIFNVLDISVMLEVLDRMNERKASAILAAMLPEKARFATQMLAQRRMREVAAPGGGAAASGGDGEAPKQAARQVSGLQGAGPT